jgi:lipopolysaccharide assembly protein B
VPLRLALILVLTFGLLVAYLTSLNASGVRVLLGPGRTYDLPLMTLIVGAFVVGATLALVLDTVRDVGRSYRDYLRPRGGQRAETRHESAPRGVEAQLAGATVAAAQAHGEVLRRDPSHPEAPMRLGEPVPGRRDVQAAPGHRLHGLRGEERTETLLALAGDSRRLGRADEAIDAYRRVLERDHDHLTALRGVRDVLTGLGRWAEALPPQEHLVRVAPREERGSEETTLAGIHYELGRARLAEGHTQGAVGQFKEALRARPDFLPATLVLGDAYLKTGDTREALRTWERALETQPVPPLLSRIEHLYRADGRPARMIALYEAAAVRHPGNQAIAFGLGRVYFGLAMLDEAAEQFEKLEGQAPDLASIHAYLGAIFERRGQLREALEEYRRALGFQGGIEWPHRCAACGAVEPSWFDRCPACRGWNTSRP